VQAGTEGLAAGAIAERLALAPSALSFHLKELTAASLLIRHPDGRHVVYRAGYPTMTALIACLTDNCCEGEACELGASAACAPSKPKTMSDPNPPMTLGRRAAAEFLGTAFLLAAVVGAGIMASA
jgi:ArsR family transcriptional regulator